VLRRGEGQAQARWENNLLERPGERFLRTREPQTEARLGLPRFASIFQGTVRRAQSLNVKRGSKPLPRTQDVRIYT
jgi:hypothetical protein